MTIAAPPDLTAPPSPPPTRADPVNFAQRSDAYHTWRGTNHSEETAALAWTYATALQVSSLASAVQSDRVLVQQAKTAIDAQSPVTNAAAAAAAASAAAVYASQAQATNPDSPIRLNPSQITADFTVPANYNATSTGPITVADGVTVTVSDNATWSIT